MHTIHLPATLYGTNQLCKALFVIVRGSPPHTAHFFWTRHSHSLNKLLGPFSSANTI